MHDFILCFLGDISSPSFLGFPWVILIFNFYWYLFIYIISCFMMRVCLCIGILPRSCILFNVLPSDNNVQIWPWRKKNTLNVCMCFSCDGSSLLKVVFDWLIDWFIYLFSARRSVGIGRKKRFLRQTIMPCCYTKLCKRGGCCNNLTKMPTS